MDPIRLARRSIDLTSNGDVYTAFPFQVHLPQQREGEPPSVQLQIDIVDNTIMAAVRSISSAPTVQIQVVMVSSPNTVEFDSGNMTLNNLSANEFSLSGALSYEETLDEAYPGEYITPANFPGGF